MITIRRDLEGFIITGHAGAGPPGSDIVCSAVSTLFQTLISSMEELTEDKIEYKTRPGCSWLIYRDLSEYGKILIESFFIGISGIVGAYPDNVIYKFSDSECRGGESQCGGRGKERNDEVHEFEQVQS